MQCETQVRIFIAGDLVGADNVEGLTRFRILPRADRAIRHDDGWLVMFQDGGGAPTGGLSQATTATVPASPEASRCSHNASWVTSRPSKE